MEVLRVQTSNPRNIVFGDWGGKGASTEAELLEYDMAGLECRLYDRESSGSRHQTDSSNDVDVAGQATGDFEITIDRDLLKESESRPHIVDDSLRTNIPFGENEEREQQGESYVRDYVPTAEVDRKRDDHAATSSDDEPASPTPSRSSASTKSRESSFDREGTVFHASLLDLVQSLEIPKPGQPNSDCSQHTEVELYLPESLENADGCRPEQQLHDEALGDIGPHVLRNSSSLSKSSTFNSQNTANTTHVKMEMWQITCYNEDGETPQEPFYVVTGVPEDATVDKHKLRKALPAAQQYSNKRPAIVPASTSAAALAKYSSEGKNAIFLSPDVLLLLDESVLKKLPKKKFVFHRVKVGAAGLEVGKLLLLSTRRFVAMSKANPKGIQTFPLVRKMKKLKLVGAEITSKKDGV